VPSPSFQYDFGCFACTVCPVRPQPNRPMLIVLSAHPHTFFNMEVCIISFSCLSYVVEVFIVLSSALLTAFFWKVVPFFFSSALLICHICLFDFFQSARLHALSPLFAPRMNFPLTSAPKPPRQRVVSPLTFSSFIVPRTLSQNSFKSCFLELPFAAAKHFPLSPVLNSSDIQKSLSLSDKEIILFFLSPSRLLLRDF